MAHGYLQQFADLVSPVEPVEVLSAGVETHSLNPKAVAVMAEDGVDISRHTSNHVDEYAHLPIDYVITVCDSASERCPVWIGQTNRLHQNFDDPSKASGTPEEIVANYQRVRDQIKAFSRKFVEKELS
jgi:arsenate reductase